MKLSIITINRNNAEGLRKTIESVISQSYGDFEYVVIDGASTDGSVDVIKQYESKISYWISEPDSGIYQAMNKGVKAAKGEYLLFLNSGDYLINSSVINDVFAAEHNADILTARCNVSNRGKIVWTSNPPANITVGVLYNIGLAHQSTFIKKVLFEKYGLYREDFKFNSDIEFWYRTIVLNNSTTEKVDVITTDYNLDGISFKQKNTAEYKAEMSEIFSNSFLQKVIPDYEAMNSERENMKIMNWIKSKAFLYKPLCFLYYIASKKCR